MQQQVQKLIGPILKEYWPICVYALLILSSIFFHEPWRDETQALLIAKAPLGIKEFFTDTLHYEGHPFLWFYVLKLFSPFGVHTLGLQIANSLFIISAVILFWWKAPLDKNLKTVLLFNYYFLFEFGVIARSYALGIFLIIFYLSFQDSKNKVLNKASFIALLLSPHVSIYSLITSAALFMPYFIESYPSKTKKALLRAILFASSCLLALLQMLPAPDQRFAPPADLSFNLNRIKTLMILLGEIFFYIPNLSLYPSIWNTSLDFPASFQIGRAIFCLILFLSLTVFIYKKRLVLSLALLTGTLVLLSFAYLKFLGGLRHMSHLLLMMLAFYWLAQEKSPREIKSSTKNILMALFSISMGTGIIMYITDLMLPFSDAKRASQTISESDKLIIGIPDYAVSTISGFIGGKEIYHLNSKRLTTYVKWNYKPNNLEANFKESMIEALDVNKADEAIFISSDPHINQRLKQIIAQDMIYESNACMVADECFSVFKIRRQQLNSGL